MAPSRDTSFRPHAVLFPLPYQGHINAMLRLAAVLHARAPDRRKLPSDYGLVTIKDGTPPELAASDDVAAFVLALNRNCAAPFREFVAGVLREDRASAGRVACVVADVDWFVPLTAAWQLGVRALTLMTGSAARFRVYLAFQRLEEKGYLPVQGREIIFK